jgi:hypothetical protein
MVRKNMKRAVEMENRSRERRNAWAWLFVMLPILETLGRMQIYAVGPHTNCYYDGHVLEFGQWYRRTGGVALATVEALDVAVHTFFESQAEQGATPSFGAKVLAGLKHRMPGQP